MFTDSCLFEGHVHVDIKSSDSKVRNVLDSYCQNHNLILVSHNLDLKLEGGLSKISAEAPIQHFDVKSDENKCFQTNFKSVNVLANNAFVYMENQLGHLIGYVEAEWVSFRDYGYTIHPFVLENSFFNCINNREKCNIDTTKNYFEFHWTVPEEFVGLNIAQIYKSGLQSVGFERNNTKYLVLTTLVPTWKAGLVLAQKVDSLQYGDWKLEVKKYYSQDMSQWKFLMTTIR
jgi:hypothetical protein